MKKRLFLSRFLFFLYFCAIAFLCFANAGSFPDVERTLFGIPTDKIVHTMMFFPLPILAFLSYSKNNTKTWQSVLFILAVMLLGCCIAGGTEMIQGFTRTRSADRMDFLADCIGLTTSCIIVFAVDITKK